MNSIYLDGTDWIHLSENFCFISPYRFEDFEPLCTMHIDLFTRNYYPKQGDIVVDVGSWNGAEIPVWSRAVGESGHVYAIEANPKFYKQSVRVVESLGLTNVTCINAALMDKPGNIDIGIFSEGGIDSSIYVDNAEEKISVPATTIDEMISDYGIKQIDYIKINIEGAEEFAIQGISDLSKIKNWCISTHDFCGIKTKDFVVNFFSERNVPIDIHEEVDDKPWEGGYIYINN